MRYSCCLFRCLFVLTLAISISFSDVILKYYPSRKKIAKVGQVREQLLVLPIIEETYDVYGAISLMLASDGKQIGDLDEIIAAITISHNGAIVTRDYHFDRLPMLDVIHY
jgi:tRNA(fMet)-specific endonuclease VapC